MRGATYIGVPCKVGHVERRVSNGLCAECTREAARRHYLKDRERIILLAGQYYASKREEKMKYAKEYSRKNKALIKAYRTRNAEKLSLARRQRRSKIGERLRAEYRAWLKKNPTYHHEWRKKNAIKVRVYCQARYARIIGAPGRYSPDDVMALLGAQNWRCQYCCTELTDKWEVDHKVPLILGGANGKDNICIACVSCNRQKNAMTAVDFASRLIRRSHR